MNEKNKAWKPKTSFAKLRARSKRRDSDSSTVAVSIQADQPFTVVERKMGAGKGVIAYHAITRETRRENARKKQLGREGDSDMSRLDPGPIDYRKRKRGK